MYRNYRLALSAIFLAGLLLNIGYAFASSRYDHAIHYYKTKHYVQAAEIFESLLTNEYAGSAEAHYYYANCLFKINRKGEAISEYRRVVQLKPDSLVGRYSSRVLKLCAGSGRDYLGRSAADRGYKTRSLGDDIVRATGSGEPSGKSPLKLKEKDAIAREVKARLPKLPELVTGYKEGVSLKTFLATGNRNHMCCREYFLKAKAAAEQAKANLKQAIAVTSGLVPSQRLRGETEDGLRARQDQYRDEIKKILKPYAENVMETEEWLREKTAVLQGGADTP